jgi:class 3 adenylate cyclase
VGEVKTGVKFVWKIPIQAPPDQLWRYIADTNRLNQYAGLPEFTFQYIPETDGGSRQVGETSYLGWRIHWDEHPFEWIEGRYYEIVRTFQNGPIRKFHTAVSLRPDNGGSIVEQAIECEPRWLFAVPLIYWEIRVSAQKRFREAYRKIEKFLLGKAEAPFVPVPRTAISHGRLEVIRERLKNAAGREWLPRLVESIERLPDEELDAMRPFVFADRWKAGRIQVLKLFLHAAQAGLLDLSWDVICPGCRGAQERHQTLRDMKMQAHCPACNIQYDADFAQSVEMTFRPNASIRRVEVVRYCSGGPMNAPHIVAQQQIRARSSKTVEMRLRPWQYRIRSPKLQAHTSLRTSAEANTAHAAIKIQRPDLEPATLELTPDLSLKLENTDDKDITVLIEKMTVNENAATASMVIAMSEFRTLFSEEVLAPATPISVGAVALMFTDLKASTNLYEKIGDAPAYGLVQRHFDLLRETISGCSGTPVKTIGDSVMAAFMDPANAVEAAFQMHAVIDKDNLARGEPALTLKIGIHHGSCIAVNMNEILDYFGTAVNLAARIQKESQGGDIIVTEDIWVDPHVQEVLSNRKCNTQKESCMVRGLSGTQNIYRIRPV